MQRLFGEFPAASRPDGGSGPLAIDAPDRYSDPRGVVAWTGRPRLGDATGERFGPALLDGIDARGADVLADLRGPFALAIAMADGRRRFLAVDRIGCERLCYAETPASLAFGSSAVEVAAASGDTGLDRQALFAFMYSHMIPSPQTVFAKVRKLAPGEYLYLDNGTFAARRYWYPDFGRDPTADIEELRGAVLPTLRRAVERSDPGDTTGAFLSGGLDSSSVTGILAQTTDRQANAFSVGFGVAEFDELEFARISANAFGCRHHTYEVTPEDIVAAIPEIAATYDEPFGNSSAVPTLACARLAKREGFDHLLAGDGGDELFGGNERYVRQRVFERYADIPAFVRKGLFDPLAMRIDPESAPLPLRKFSSYVRQATIPLPERFESWNLIYREGTDAVFSPEFLATVEPELHFGHMSEVWNDCPSDDLLDRMLWYDWKFILADNDLRKVTTMCDLAGVRVSYPMLDEDLIDLSVRVPSDRKVSRGELRTFFKDSVRPLLPPQIITKTKHGFGLPFGQWLKSHEPLRELVFGSLDSLSRRGLFREDFVRRVGDEHREGHASYYGYAIWDMVSIEQWFQAHSDQLNLSSLP